MGLLDRIGASRAMMKFLTAYCGFGFLVVLVSNVWSISTWTETRAVYDDICYLRQAHLFERFGLGGLDTNITRDDDHYLRDKLKEIKFPTWSDVTTAPCHTPMPASKKLVLQYPPGTGFVLSLFPAGFQVIPLYALTSIVAVMFSFVAMSRAVTIYALMLVAAFGDCVIYLMINPTKASYSMAPTMMVCARGLSDREAVFRRGAAAAPCSHGADRSSNRIFRQFKAAKSVPVGRLFHFLSWIVPDGSKQREVLGRPLVRHRIPDRARADAGCQYDQCRKSFRDHLWRR
jgi:hypothetical protein